MADYIDKIRVNGTDYDIKDPNLTEEVSSLKSAVTNNDFVNNIVLNKKYQYTGNTANQYVQNVLPTTVTSGSIALIDTSGVDDNVTSMVGLTVHYTDGTETLLVSIEEKKHYYRFSTNTNKTISKYSFRLSRSTQTPSSNVTSSWNIICIEGETTDQKIENEYKHFSALTTDELLLNETYQDTGSGVGVWENNVVPNTSTGIYVTVKSVIGVDASAPYYAYLHIENTDNTSINTYIYELNKPYKAKFLSGKTVRVISLFLQRRSNEATIESRETEWNVVITKGSEYGEFVNFEESIHKPLAGMIPSNYAYQYPIIDTYKKTMTLYPNFTFIDDRFPAGSVSNAGTLTCDYSSVSSSAVVFYWKVSNNTVVAYAYNIVVDAKEYIPFCLLRTSTKAVSSVCPVVVDGRLFGNVLTVEENQNVKGIGHRGFTSVAPENTLISYKVAKENGYTYVETDVRYTQDGVPVLLHDETINRTSNGTGNIADLTYAQVSQYDFGSWKGSAFTGEKIPTFEQFCIICHRLGLHPYIEIKVGTQQQTEALVKTAIKCGLKGYYTWVSYYPEYLGYVKGIDSNARLGLIADEYASSLISQAQQLKTDSNDVFINISFLNGVDATATSELADAGIPLETYTNSDAQMIANSYVTGITTDLDCPSAYLYRLWKNGLT